MTRTLLALFVSAFALVVGVATAQLQCKNHMLASELDSIKRRCDLLRAGNESLRTEIVAGLYSLEKAWRAADSAQDEEHRSEAPSQ